MKRFSALLYLLPACSWAEVDFATQIQPILSQHCYACHGPDEASLEGGLRLDVKEKALKGGDGGKVIIPGDPEASELINRITHSDPEEIMPPPEKKKPLPPEQVALLKQWIAEGAPWGTHWAFTAPQRPPVPSVKQQAWVKNPIDAFVLARLEDQGLAPAAPADATTLLRRLSLDLIGLPPTLEDIAALRADTAPDWYEKQVERLLASPHYGEHWARNWMDAAQYADSDGFEKDKPRQVWTWRD